MSAYIFYNTAADDLSITSLFWVSLFSLVPEDSYIPKKKVSNIEEERTIMTLFLGGNRY